MLASVVSFPTVSRLFNEMLSIVAAVKATSIAPISIRLEAKK